ncbi:MAG: flagellar type III secretion system pore protein FliP [Peptococcaceae bacterium]|jgi:flagellar biosynthetic protein FliP|nr:flagellar type III secretion system pore protein FliP [Peptococcaceae bacterium]
MMRNNRRFFLLFLGLCLLLTPAVPLQAADVALPSIDLNFGSSSEPQDIALSLQILALLTVLSLAPAFMILATSFTRIIVVLSFLRNALATQQMPPNQVLVGLALFLTFFTMTPVWNEVYQNALEPYFAGEMVQQEAITNAVTPIRAFMLRQTRDKDLALFVSFSDMDQPGSQDDLPMTVIIPAYAISELKTAFQIGFMLYLPFIVIDMVVASVLMSMGMMMLPPMMISLPFKLILFILLDGWNLVVETLLSTFA